MGVPVTSTGFPDVLDARFAEIYDNRFKEVPDMISTFYNVVSGASAPTRDTYRTSEVGAFGDVPEFTGTVTYDDVNQGYDGTITPKEYASGYQIERKLFDDDLTGIMESKPSQLSIAVARTRQKHAAQPFNNAFSVDSTWNSYSENVALCSDSHTTTAPGVSTTSGFDNLIISALSAVALAAARIQFRGLKGDRGQALDIEPDMLLIPPDLYQTAFEITESMGVPDNANNAANVHRNKYKVIEWQRLSSTRNWYLIDSTLMKDGLHWIERVGMEFAMVEDFDKLSGKWRVYLRYGNGHNSWRWLIGAQVA